MKEKFILDACCGGRCFWFDKNHANVLYIDNRNRYPVHSTFRPNHKVEPDIIMDFRNLDFADKSFKMVVFDPPHLTGISILIGKETCRMTKAYGWLERNTWKEDIKKGFDECWRVLDDYGALIFKWNEGSIKIKEVLEVIVRKPLFGHPVGSKLNTHWLCFMKFPEGKE